MKAKPKYMRFFILALLLVFLAYRIPNSIEGIQQEISDLGDERRSLQSEQNSYFLVYGRYDSDIQYQLSQLIGDELRLYDQINFRNAMQMPLYYGAIGLSLIGTVQLLRSKKYESV